MWDSLSCYFQSFVSRIRSAVAQEGALNIPQPGFQHQQLPFLVSQLKCSYASTVSPGAEMLYIGELDLPEPLIGKLRCVCSLL